MFLRIKQLECPYSVWIAEPGTGNCRALENRPDMEPPSLQISSEEGRRIRLDKGRTAAELVYSTDFAAVVLFGGKIELNGDDLAVLSDLLYKEYSDHLLESGRARLNRIIDSIGETTASLDLEEVFSNILANTLEVITNADYGTLWLYDEKIGKLTCKASEGYRYEEVRQMEFNLGEGPVGHAFREGKPVLIKDPSDPDYRKASRISAENKKRWGRMVEDITNIRSVIAYPVLVDGRVECVMYLGQMGSADILTERDLWLLQIFTTQVGIAIRNARQFSDIRQLNDNLIRRDAIHATLTNLSVRNMGTEKITAELSRMAGQPLLFVDLIVNETVPSGVRLPENLTYGALLKRIENGREAGRIDIGTNGQMALYPVRSGTVVLGCLIVESPSGLGRIGEMAIEQGASVLALELFQKQNVLGIYYKNQRELFEAILRTHDPDLLQEKADALGIRSSAGLTAAILQVSGGPDPQELETAVFRLIAMLRKTAQDQLQMIFGWQNRMIILAALESPSEQELFEKRLAKLFADPENNPDRYRLRGGLGSPVNGLHQIKRTYREAEIALNNPISDRSSARPVRYAEIGLRRLFTNRNTEEANKFLTDIFGPIRKADRTGGALEQTLITYFEHNRSAGETAEKIHVHINTLYQRLKKIEDTLGLSFKNPDDVLQLQLACYLSRHMEPEYADEI